MTANCKNCAFFKRPPLVTNDEGRCHRFPPTVNMVSRGAGVAELSAFPATKNANWCGEHQPQNIGHPLTDLEREQLATRMELANDAIVGGLGDSGNGDLP
jgi:hypothetical protein